MGPKPFQTLFVFYVPLSLFLLIQGVLKTQSSAKLFSCFARDNNCISIQETHSDDSDVKFWSQRWGDKILFSHGTNRSTGVAMSFNRCPGKILWNKADEDGHWVACAFKVSKSADLR